MWPFKTRVWKNAGDVEVKTEPIAQKWDHHPDCMIKEQHMPNGESFSSFDFLQVYICVNPCFGENRYFEWGTYDGKPIMKKGEREQLMPVRVN